ncbi:MAG: DUF3108 domain-containing protein [Micavibrio sp.]
MNRIFTVLLSAITLISFTYPARAEVGSHKQTMLYDVYAGGIHAVKAQLDVSYEKNNRYKLFLGANTIGFLERLVPWKGTFETEGWRLGNKGERPEVHRSTATWKGEDELKEYFYGKDGVFKKLRILEDDQDKSPQSVDAELVDGTIDVLTATLSAMQNVAADGQCAGTSEIFDGKRRFEIVFKHESDETLVPTDYNVYQGPSARCQVEVKPLTGEWHKKPRGWMSIQEQGRQKGSLPTVWFAKVSEDGPAVPVKVRVKTEYGTLFMHLTEYHNGDKVIKTASQE